MSINITIDTDDEELKASLATLLKSKLQGTGLEVDLTEELKSMTLNRTSYMSILKIQQEVSKANIIVKIS